MVQIFPKFDNLVRQYDDSLDDALNILGEAIAKNFKTLIEFANPQFWDRFKQQKTGKGKGTPKRRKSRKGSSASVASSILTEDDSSSILTEDSWLVMKVHFLRVIYWSLYCLTRFFKNNF